MISSTPISDVDPYINFYQKNTLEKLFPHYLGAFDTMQ